MTRHSWGTTSTRTNVAQVSTCDRCGCTRRSYRGGSLRRLLAEVGQVVAGEIQARWPNADVDHCRLRGVVVYRVAGGAEWTLDRPDCEEVRP